MTYVDLRPDNTRPVEVLVGGRWWPGELEAYSQHPSGVWRGYVRWTDADGGHRLGWFSEQELRRVGN